jgi:hypothetical protein
MSAEGVHLRTKEQRVVKRNDFPTTLRQCDTSRDTLTEQETVASPGNIRLFDLNTGCKVFAHASDLPGKENLLAAHAPALSMGDLFRRGGDL